MSIDAAGRFTAHKEGRRGLLGRGARRTAFMATALIAVILLLGNQPVIAQLYKKAEAPVEARLRDLLSRMTLEEKFWQLFMLSTSLPSDIQKCSHGVFGLQVSSLGSAACSATAVNSIQRRFVEDTRLGIPIIPFDEALHGLVQPGTTAFPQAIALAATFDTALMSKVAKAIALECRGRGIRQVLSPVVNIAGDVRWGRVEETYGEDPYLAAEMGAAYVSEFERLGIITTPKHFLANVGDGGRDSYPIHTNERLLREIYLPPFEACIRRGGSRSIMAAYNSLDGSPCTANDWLNNRLLKGELGFAGYVISDAGAVGGANHLHLTAADYAQATEHALEGGLDVIFQTSYDQYPLFVKAFQDGRIDQKIIDRAVSRVLRAKLEMGLFDNPYVDPAQSDLEETQEAHLRLARQVAQESIVLLKNDNHTLPLKKGIRTIAVFGPEASEARLGGYSGPGIRKISILEGIRNAVGQSAQVVTAKGCDRISPGYVPVPAECLWCSPQGTVQPGLFGEYFDNISLSGRPVLRRIDPQIQFQWALLSPDPQKLPRDFYSVRWSGKLRAPETGRFKIGIDGNDGYRLFINGQVVIDNWKKVSHRVLLAGYYFEKGREYDIRIEFFEPAGNGLIKLVWDQGVSSEWIAEMDEALRLARQSDVAIVAAGIEEGEFRDRARLGLPGRQEELISRVAAAGKPTVVILVGGSAVTMGGWLDNVAAVLEVWYPGEQGGVGVADVLFGKANPAGRLPITFPLAEGQLPLVYNQKPTGRGNDYGDLSGEPLFPFGYGLSYTSFEYGNLSFDRQRIPSTGSAVVRFAVKNTGPMEGDEVVQLYIHDEMASLARPVTELKGFQRIHLKPGEMKEVIFDITPEMLFLLDRDLRRVVEAGDFRIMIGSSSKDIRLRGIVTAGD
jgi:beta-glucosidase